MPDAGSKEQEIRWLINMQHIFTEDVDKVIKLCKNHGKPMFLLVSHLAVHTGVPGPNVLEVSNKTHNDIRFNYIENKERRLYAGKKK